MNWLDLFDDNAEAARKLNREHARTELSGVCDDDVEATCPYVNMMPEESDKEGASPLHFTNGEMDRQIQEAFAAGF